MKPAVLICLYAFHPFENANTNVMMPWIEAMKERYDVTILTKNNDNSAPQTEQWRGVHICRYRRPGRLLARLLAVDAMDYKKRRGLMKDILVWLCYPPVHLGFTVGLLEHPEYRLLRRLLRQNKYGLVLSTCESFSSHKNVLRAKKKGELTSPWIAYFMDPHATFIVNQNGSSKLMEEEAEVYRKCDLALVTEEIYEENRTNVFQRYLEKTHPVRFGNFRCAAHPLINPIFEPGKINCVYVGSLLNPKIRDPEYFYKMINALDDRFVFHIVCNRFSEENRRQRDRLLKESDRVRWYHDLPLWECLGIISHADLLINLGNKSLNQTPSKVFDYIGTGRPVVNFYSLENDTSKRYLSRYPNALNLYEDGERLLENAKIFAQFAVERKGRVVSREELRKLYSEYESNRVTGEVMRYIETVMEQQKGG